MPRLGRVGPYHWRFCLVPRLCPLHLFLKRSGKEMQDLGTLPQGFKMFFGLGDAVYFRRHKRRTQLMFRLGFHPRRRYAIIKYGEGYGPIPGQYRKLDNLSPEAFANGGVEPTEDGNASGAD